MKVRETHKENRHRRRQETEGKKRGLEKQHIYDYSLNIINLS